MIKNFSFYILILLTIAGCRQTRDELILVPAAKGNSYYGGILRLSKTEYIHTLYPPSITDPVSTQVASMIYEGLFKTDPKTLEVIPSLAESYEVNSDSTIYTFQIKKGVLFHDDPCFPNGKGRELKAGDIVYSLIQLCIKSPDNQGFALFKNRLKGINEYFATSDKNKKLIVPEAIKQIDDYHFQLILEKPNPDILFQLTRPQAFIYPIEAINKYGTVRPKAVGTGPFMLTEVEREISINLSRNPHYHRHDVPGNQLPFLSQINIQFIPDKRSELAEFKGGNIQMMYHLPPEQFIEIMKIESMENKPEGWEHSILVRKPEIVTHYLAFNCADKFFKSSSLRKAFAYSIDKTTILSTTLNGEGLEVAEHGLISPAYPSYPAKNVRGISERQDSARTLLEVAPIPSEKPTLIFYPDGSRNTLVAIAIVDQIKNTLGIEVNLQPMPLAKLQEALTEGKFTIVLLSKTPDYAKPISYLENFYSRNIISYKGKTYPNVFQYQNKVFDEWYEKALAAKQATEANAAVLQAEQQLINDAVVIPLWYDEKYMLLKDNLKNIPTHPLNMDDFSEVYFTPETQQKEKSKK
ncbi:ABC transporter substrate-binding protein [Cytophagaceae bacterium YF14B1]|uniref:ABC transporter substrate-binding protein n=1 Tax=Xanthocytophaga flava TaxID=3048013 RepID=A0AAE3QPD9_9BACT|nr:ABC transporter substrate-binding protein [Xanthocytophaga flavus]MDJ1482436.1 ABC transporter substrate-binding protein [Xanthocytophaga flavus]